MKSNAKMNNANKQLAEFAILAIWRFSIKLITGTYPLKDTIDTKYNIHVY